jgi:hypothetical protein
MIFFFFSPAGAAPPAGIDLRDCLEAIYPTLNAQGPGDLVWWTESELYAWLDEAAKKLARSTGCFLTRDDTTVVVVAGTGAYSLPARHISTVHASLSGRMLDRSNVQELEARDSAWPDSQADISQPFPLRYSLDAGGPTSIVLHPKPNTGGGGPLAIVMHQYPATIEAGASVAALPAPLREYFTFFALGEARGKESKGAMYEVGRWYRQLAGLVEQVAMDYYGQAQ